MTPKERFLRALKREPIDRPSAGTRMIGEETIAVHDEDYIAAALSGTAWVVDPRIRSFTPRLEKLRMISSSLTGSSLAAASSNL